MTAAHRVAVFVAPTFATELEQLAGDRHVWALRVPEYERRTKPRGEELDSGITLFNGGGLGPEAELLEILPTIEEHHPDCSQIEVFGAQPTADLRAELSVYGFDDISPSPRGFTARRDA